jgi:hypothetical protein
MWLAMATRGPSKKDDHDLETTRVASGRGRDDDVDVAVVPGGSVESLGVLVQARLKVSSPSDAFEVEAENAAHDFVSSKHGAGGAVTAMRRRPVLRRVDVDEQGAGLEGSGAGLSTTDDVGSAIRRSVGGGRGLDGGSRSQLEGYFGADLAGVRVHADAKSDALCRSINAEAFTSGRDVFFSAGSYQPGTASGDHLLAHELTHVVQQGQAPVSARFARRAAEGAVFRKGAPTSAQTDARQEAQKKAAMDKAAHVREQGRQHTPDASVVATGKGVAEGVKGGKGVKDTFNAMNAGFNAKGGSPMDTMGNGNSFYSTTPVAGASGQQVGAQQKLNGKDAAMGVGTLALDVATLVKSIHTLYSTWDDATPQQRRDAAIEAFKQALTTTKSSVELARGFGGPTARAAVPGLGLAIELIDFAQTVVNLVDKGRVAFGAFYSASNEKDPYIKAAKQKVTSMAKVVFFSDLAKAVGQTTTIVGQIATLSGAGAPWGLAVVAAGGFVKGAAAVGEMIAQWKLASQTYASREAVANAQANLMEIEAQKGKNSNEAKDAGRKLEEARIANLAADGDAAVRQMIAKAMTKVPDGKPVPGKRQPMKFDSAMVKYMAGIGITEADLQAYEMSGKNPVLLDGLVTKSLAGFRTTPNPATFMGTIRAIGAKIASLWKAITGAFSTTSLTPTTAPTIIFDDVYGRVKSLFETEIFTQANLAKGKINEQFVNSQSFVTKKNLAEIWSYAESKYTADGAKSMNTDNIKVMKQAFETAMKTAKGLPPNVLKASIMCFEGGHMAFVMNR